MHDHVDRVGRDGAQGPLVLADGTTFGELVGAPPPGGRHRRGQSTVLAGYQEVLSDPSYAGRSSPSPTRTSATTAPTTGTTSRRPFVRGVVVRLARRPSSWRSTGSLDDYLRSHGVPGIAGVDTRRLTRHIL